MNSREHALIVAGGKGTRLNSNQPKQFLLLDRLPVLMHTINAFYNYSKAINIVLVLPEDQKATWQSLCLEHHFSIPVVIQDGGSSRFQSVKKGLEKIDDGFVAIHDGVRPLVGVQLIAESFRVAREKGAAVAAVPLKESIRKLSNSTSKALDRTDYRLIQTPQTFDVSLIKKAYQTAEDAALTDDASVAERAGYPITLVEGSYENIKITTIDDLAIAEFMMFRLKAGATR
jgi:2-C-methyl-D-erythritol 4-phosphate cytidylyltransferase